MSKTPLVSVIMNCHNGEKYLKKSIKSLQDQTFKNWELIFWNNNSSDNSRKILKSFKDRRIKYYESLKLHHLYKARNLAIKKAKGKYICFLDTDDWWDRKKIDVQLKQFKSDKSLFFVYSNYYLYFQNLKLKKKRYFKNLSSGRITQELLDDYTIAISSVMLKKKIFEKYRFKNKYSIIGDFELFIKLSLNFNIGCIQTPLLYYRIHSNNYSKLKLSLYKHELKDWLKYNNNKLNLLNYSTFRVKIYFIKIKIKEFLSNFMNLN